MISFKQNSSQSWLLKVLYVFNLMILVSAHTIPHNADIRARQVPDAQSPSNWQQEASAKMARTQAKIPTQWLLSRSVIKEVQQQGALIGTRNTGKTIEDLIETLPQSSFSNPFSNSSSSSTASKTIEITNTDPVDLIAAMRNHTYTASDVVLAFSLRSAVIHQVHPVLLDVAYAEAYQAAQELDAYFASTGQLKGPLHGLPVSFKDLFHAANMETSGSYVAWFAQPNQTTPPRTLAEYTYLTLYPSNFDQNPKTFDSQITQKLKDQGAVPIAKTTVMQTTWDWETANNMIGWLTNPYQLELSAAGSTGGEGVLQALGGAAFGIGEDSGGSVSMPASLHGLYSIKPSSGYTFATSNGTQELIPDESRILVQDAVNFGTMLEVAEITCPGIMARSMRALDYVYSAVVPSSTSAGTGGLTVAYLDNDGYITPHPPIQRAMNMVKDALGKASSVSVKNYTGTSPHQVSSIHGVLTGSGIDTFYYRNVTGEPFVPIFETTPADQPPPWNAQQQQQLDKAVTKRDQYRSEYETLFTNLGLDTIIMPTFASTDWPRNGTDSVEVYTSVANTLNIPSITMLVTFASAEIDKAPTNFQGMNARDTAHMALYNPAQVDGTPISVMLLGRLNGEADLLAAAEVVAQMLGTPM